MRNLTGLAQLVLSLLVLFNDRLESGANHMPPLFNTIIRFMMHPVVLTADIEAPFPLTQIFVNTEKNLSFA